MRSAITLAPKLAVEIVFRDHARAYGASFFPAVRQLYVRSVSFETGSYFELLRTLSFVLRG